MDFIYPHIVPVCFLNFDDYGFPTCARARWAVGEAFTAIGELPIRHGLRPSSAVPGIGPGSVGARRGVASLGNPSGPGEWGNDLSMGRASWHANKRVVNSRSPSPRSGRELG